MARPWRDPGRLRAGLKWLSEQRQGCPCTQRTRTTMPPPARHSASVPAMVAPGPASMTASPPNTAYPVRSLTAKKLRASIVPDSAGTRSHSLLSSQAGPVEDITPAQKMTLHPVGGVAGHSRRGGSGLGGRSLLTSALRRLRPLPAQHTSPPTSAGSVSPGPPQPLHRPGSAPAPAPPTPSSPLAPPPPSPCSTLAPPSLYLLVLLCLGAFLGCTLSGFPGQLGGADIP
jgi:hypothetical protein